MTNTKPVIGALLVMSLLSACTTLPSRSEPQALRSYQPSGNQADGPIADRDPDLLLRDFYTASAEPAQQYQLARSYLTPAAATSWTPQQEILVVDRFDINASKVSGARREYTVRGNIIGSISAGGRYNARSDEFSDTVTLEQVGGQWRVAGLANQIVIERTEMRNRYVPRAVYFFDPSASVLVQDRRWLHVSTTSLDSALIQLTVEGPSHVIAPGVMNELPKDVAYGGVVDGAYQFSGMVGLSDEALERFVIELVWTLAMAEVPQPYRFTFDGIAYTDAQGNGAFTAESFPEYNPQAIASATTNVYTLTDGQISVLSNNQSNPVDGSLGAMRNIESAKIAGRGETVALVQATGEGDDKRSKLLVGAFGREFAEILEGKTITRPTFEFGATSVWAVVDGRTIVRASRSATTGEIAETEVEYDRAALPSDAGDISVLQLSLTGARAAFIVDGDVYIATVSRPIAGERRLTNIQPVAPALEASALALEWQADGTLVVGTSIPEAPVWVVTYDGATVAALPSGNLSAPVVSVASSYSTLYVTDARATLEIPNASTTAEFWREVRGLEGKRSTVIVPR